MVLRRLAGFEANQPAVSSQPECDYVTPCERRLGLKGRFARRLYVVNMLKIFVNLMPRVGISFFFQIFLDNPTAVLLVL
jgi:hypothetical protein